MTLGLAASPDARAEAFSWTDVADETVAALNEALLHQAEGDVAQCKRAITRAYFGVFEEQKMEAAMRKMLGESHAFMVERQFSALRRTAATATPAEFGQIVATLAEQLRTAAVQLDALGVPKEVYNAR
jgi:fumarate hydratase class II/high-affinity iron transporter